MLDSQVIIKTPSNRVSAFFFTRHIPFGVTITMYVDGDNHTEHTRLRSFVTSQTISSQIKGNYQATIIHVFVHWPEEDPYSGSKQVTK
jgi:hypothetical protein